MLSIFIVPFLCLLCYFLVFPLYVVDIHFVVRFLFSVLFIHFLLLVRVQEGSWADDRGLSSHLFLVGLFSQGLARLLRGAFITNVVELPNLFVLPQKAAADTRVGQKPIKANVIISERFLRTYRPGGSPLRIARTMTRATDGFWILGART
jgi:hypothetical protein